MKKFLFLLLLCAPAFAQPPVIDDWKPPQDREQYTYMELKLYEPLPDYVYAMDRETFMLWAAAQNRMAYESARKLADDYLKENPRSVTDMINEDSVATTVVNNSNDYNNSWTIDDWMARTYYSKNTTVKSFVRERWGGGPVWLINPFAKRPPKIITTKTVTNADGDVVEIHKFLCDPDKVIKDAAAAKKFLDDNA